MKFEKFNNAFRLPSSVPQIYRTHPSLRKLFREDSFVRPAEDPVTLWAVSILHEHYGVPLEALGLELSADFSEGSHQGGRRYQGRAAVVVYDDRYVDSVGSLDVAFIMIEAMEPSKRYGGTEPEGWVDHLNRLNAYMSASPSARYAILTNGIQTEIFRRDLDYPRKLEPIGDLPKYESAREAALHSPYIVVLNADEPDGIQTGLLPLTRDKFREVLGDTRSGCHSILRDNEGLQPQEAVDAMVKFLFAKWYDEQATIDLVKDHGESRAYVFSSSIDTDPERLVVQVRDTFEKAKAWEREVLAKKFGHEVAAHLAFADTDSLELKPHTTLEIVKKLQAYSLRRSSADVKGGVFEDFLGKTFRDDLGQYFTPAPVINLMVGITQPNTSDFVGDPACGSARMLTHALDFVRQNEPSAGEGLTASTEEPSTAYVRFRDNHLFGAEVSRNLMHIARINALMNGAQYADLKIMDSLSPLMSVTGGISAGLPDRPGFYPEGLTVILTNPPFGAKVTNPRILEDLASRHGVTRRKAKIIDSIPQEIAFINRCLEFLTARGRLAIVLPESVLANSSNQYVRDWILRWARLKAVVSLPIETFAPFGAGVKTSVVVLEKRDSPLEFTAISASQEGSKNARVRAEDKSAKSLLSALDLNPGAGEEDYSVFFARIDNIGYDATGRLRVPEADAKFPPDVAEIVSAFHREVGW